MGQGHRAVGAGAGLTLAALTHVPAWQWPLIVAAAVATSSGPLSPDVDQSGWWRLTDRIVPDEALGDGGPLQHRGITHWWALPALGAVLVHVLAPGAGWVAYAALTGWASHLVGDFVFGREGCGRGPGIPLLGWRAHIGLGLPVGGWLERATASVVVPTTIAALTAHAWAPLVTRLV